MHRDNYYLKNVTTRMIENVPFLSKEPISGPEVAIRVLAHELKDYDREVLYVVNLDSCCRPLNASMVSMGTINKSITSPREILKTAILSNATSVLILHNHVSDNLTPSKEDISITDQMQRVCDLIGIPLLDHIIVGRSGFFSFKEKNIFPLHSNTYAKVLDDIKFDNKNVAYKHGDYPVPNPDNESENQKLGIISVDLELISDGKFDMWLSTEGSSGAHYAGITATDVGVHVKELAECLKEAMVKE